MPLYETSEKIFGFTSLTNISFLGKKNLIFETGDSHHGVCHQLISIDKKSPLMDNILSSVDIILSIRSI